jgi:hypothetical protein
MDTFKRQIPLSNKTNVHTVGEMDGFMSSIMTLYLGDHVPNAAMKKVDKLNIFINAY